MGICFAPEFFSSSFFDVCTASAGVPAVTVVGSGGPRPYLIARRATSKLRGRIPSIIPLFYAVRSTARLLIPVQKSLTIDTFITMRIPTAETKALSNAINGIIPLEYKFDDSIKMKLIPRSKLEKIKAILKLLED